jgi:TetR/AcrR family transcriptional regulator, fatty acid metabolism regulator protein
MVSMRVKEGNKDRDILEAAIKVFGEFGYHKSKISKIAEVAGVATGSVYVYFEDKEDILLQIFEEIWTKLHDELLIVKSNKLLSPSEKFDSLIDLVFDVYTENPSLAMVFVNEQNHLQRSADKRFTIFYEKFMNVGEEIFKEGIDKGIFSEAVDVGILRYYVFGAIRNLLHHWAVDPKSYPLNKIRQNVKSLTRRGIQK